MGIILTVILIIVVINWNSIKNIFMRTINGLEASIHSKAENDKSTQTASPQCINDAIIQKAVEYPENIIASSAFQNLLKSSNRTQDEVSEEEHIRKNNKIKADAKRTLEGIRSEILQKANQAQYLEISGKKIVSVEFAFPYEYYNKSVISPTYAKQINGRFSVSAPLIDDMDSYTRALMQMSPADRRKYRLVQQTPQKTIFAPRDIEDYKLFMDLLQEQASIDGITIQPAVVEHNQLESGRIEHSFPATLLGDLRLKEISLILKCTCAIPDKYSADVPLKVNISPDIDEETNISNNSISIDNMEGHQFEQFCAALLRKNGYSDVDVTRGSGDQGIDIIAYKGGVKFGIQCKCYSADIGNKAVQEAYSGKTYYNCHVGIVLTNRYFTRSAVDLSKSNGILLWDRKYLLDLVKKSGIKIDER